MQAQGTPYNVRSHQRETESAELGREMVFHPVLSSGATSLEASKDICLAQREKQLSECLSPNRKRSVKLAPELLCASGRSKS